ncbi:MAG: DUF2917 domain-containing protein [Rhodoferax sp.]|nr:DUF2917 domain-containing protein [Rhodoferax sp.]MBP8135975.1 DUF2917 domain-containing protein [Rhodoferax sp.]
MTSQPSMKMHSPAASETLGGCWKLASGRAMTLQPREAGVLRINAGQVWATLDGPHTGRANDWGDLFLTKGQRLNLQPGQRVVIEPRGDAVNRPAYFEWEPTSVEQGRTVGNASRWQMAVVQPARDMGAALVLVMGAARRLASGLLGYSEFVVAGRGRVLPGLESNQP